MAFFGDMPFPVQFLLAFVIVLGLIGATALMMRRLSGRISGGVLRGRQPRLAVVDYASVDGRRRLVLVRRDNVEHLVMIGGPTDIVVEANIVRAAAGLPARMPATTEALPRAIPMPEGAAANGSGNGPPAWPAQPEVSSRTQRDPMAAFADELSAPRSRPQARPQPVVPRPEARRDPANRQNDWADIRQEPRLSSQPAAEAFSSTDQTLAEMAQQLEAALRKPVAKTERIEAHQTHHAAMPRPLPRVEPGPEPAPFAAPSPVRGPESTRGSGSSSDDDLEQEMASLLGRSAGAK